MGGGIKKNASRNDLDAESEEEDGSSKIARRRKKLKDVGFASKKNLVENASVLFLRENHGRVTSTYQGR